MTTDVDRLRLAPAVACSAAGFVFSCSATTYFVSWKELMADFASTLRLDAREPILVLETKGAAMKKVQLECLATAGCLPAACWRADGTFFNANDALCRLLGYSGNDIDTGKIRWREITPPEYRTLDDEALAEIRERGQCSPFEKEYISSDGCRVPVLIVAAAFNKSVVDSGSFCAIDLRQRKRLGETDDAAMIQSCLLTARQRLICLLCAYGVSQKRIATLLDIGLRTVELERQLAARALGLPTPAATLWAASNRQLLRSSARTDGLLTPSVEAVIAAGSFPSQIDYASDVPPYDWAI